MMDQLPALLLRLTGRWTSGLAGWAIASALVWYVLPAVPAFQSPARRLAAIVLMLALCLGANTFISLRRRRRNRALAAAVEGGAGTPTREADAREEVAALRARMREALARLGRRGRDVYERPWYVLIGPPGAGKTTALLQSGLHFPLAREMGTPSLGGVGGTRLCDWWFADEAVLIDTAGRYTTQDSDAPIDQAGWLGFLDLLRRTRPRQPINGVLVVLPVADLATTDEAERVAQARAVRRRIDEITDRLRLRVPVYLVLSKADRLHGFDAFFDDLDQSARAQVWGTTFALDEGPDGFADAFRALMGRLEDRLVERLQAERSAERRALIGMFPLQVASLAPPIERFVRETFAGSRLDPAPWLRGVYLTSATQAGTPIDRLTGLLARSFGIDQAQAPALRPVSERGYFLTSLVRDVVRGEAMLVRDRPERARRRRILRAAAFGAIGVTTVLLLVLLWRIDAAEQAAIVRNDEAVTAYRQALADLPLDPVSSDDLPQVAAVLDRAASLRGPIPSVGAPLGLSQTRKLATIDGLIDKRALRRILLPRLLWRLETQMRARFDEPTFLYQATRVYLMLGGDGPLDPALVRAWMEADWASRYPGTLNAPLRKELLGDLDALLAGPLPEVALDGALVDAARATFSRVTLAERIYSRIKADDENAGAVPDWSPAGALGRFAARFFVRPSGKSLDDAIPGFLTASGYRDEFEATLPATTRAVASESWVLGHDQQIPADGPHLAALEAEVTALWVGDVERRWDAMLGDLALAPLGERDAALQSLYVLGSPQSPMRTLLVSVAHALTPEPAATRAQGATAGSAGRAGPDGDVSDLFAANGPGATADALDGLRAHYAALVSVVAGHPPLPIADILHLVNELQSELAAAGPGSTSLSATLQDGGDPTASLLAEAAQRPAPVSLWLRQIANGGNAALNTAVHKAASSAFGQAAAGGANGEGPEALCHAVVDGHYPFEPSSGEDASIDDFTRLFSPGGALDTYYQSQIRPYVDTRGATWRPRAVDGIAAPVNAAAVASFQRAAEIRDAFFVGGPAEVRFTLMPEDASARAMFSMGGTSVATGVPGTPVAFTWPVANGPNTASVTFTGARPAAAAGSTSAPAAAFSEEGPWALFRLLADGSVSPDGEPTRFGVAFAVGTSRALFGLVAGSSTNPFGRNLLAGFRCPGVR